MASDNKFAHISVNAGDDDVVIHAGAAAMAESDGYEAAPGGIESEAIEGEPLGATLQPDGAVAAERAETTQTPSKSAYRETTLEDIQGSTMGLTQKVVIALAIVLVIAVIIWMAFFNG